MTLFIFYGEIIIFILFIIMTTLLGLFVYPNRDITSIKSLTNVGLSFVIWLLVIRQMTFEFTTVELLEMTYFLA